MTGTRGCVLQVAPDPDEAIAAALEAAGLEVVTACDAEAGRRVVTDGAVDCVLAAVDPPETTGLDLVRGVHDLDDRVPVVVHGPAAEPTAAELATHVAAYVERRGDASHVDELVDAVETAVDRHRTRRDRRLVAENGPVGTCLVRDGTVVHANPALGALFDADVATIEGTRLDDLVADAGGRPIAERLAAASSGEEITREFEIRRDGGERIVVESRWRVATGGDERVVVGTLVDVTDRVERERRLARDSEMLDSLLENVPMSIYFKDRLSRHERVSDYLIPRPWEHIENHEGKVHVHPEDVIGKSDFDLYAPAFAQETVADDRRVVEEEEPIVNELEEGTTSLGETQYFATTKAPRYDQDGNVVGLVGVTVDVTDRELHKQELERQNERLDEFAEVLTHDLRNPLNLARGYLDLLADDHDDAHVAECAGSLDRMADLIEEIRAFVLQGRTVESPEAVELAEAARAAWRAVETADATLQVDADLAIRADPNRLRRVFENLFRNAIEHAGPDVTVRVGTFDGGFFVEDDGPGIDGANRERVLERGFSTSDDGTGFGLAIVDNIAAAHDWSVAITEGGGGDVTGGRDGDVTGGRDDATIPGRDDDVPASDGRRHASRDGERQGREPAGDGSPDGGLGGARVEFRGVVRAETGAG